MLLCCPVLVLLSLKPFQRVGPPGLLRGAGEGIKQQKHIFEQK